MPEKQPAVVEVEDNKTGDNCPKATATINDRTGLNIAVIAIVLGGMALGGEIVRIVYDSILRDQERQLIDAKIVAAMAPANEKVRTATTDARLALDRADNMVAQLEAKKLLKLENR